MSKKKRRVADYEWASVAQYLVWLEARLKLVPFDVSEAYSFPYARLGGEKLAMRKRRMGAVIAMNMSKIEAYAGDGDNDLGEAELVIIRSMYLSIKELRQMVDGHAIEATKLLEIEQESLLGHYGPEDDSDLGGEVDDLQF